VRTRLSHVWILLCICGAILIAIGCFLHNSDLSLLATFLGQAGTPNPRLLEKLRLIPILLIVTGVQYLLLGGIGTLRWRSLASSSCKAADLIAPQLVLWLVVGWAAISTLTLNFGGISLLNRFAQSVSPSEQVALDFGADYQVVRAVRETTAESDAILIKTGRPLQFLLNYELYPRKFYFYSDRSLPISSIPEEWMNRRHICWTLEISDSVPLEFKLLPRRGSI